MAPAGRAPRRAHGPRWRRIPPGAGVGGMLTCCVALTLLAGLLPGAQGGVLLNNWSAMGKMFLYASTGDFGIGSQFNSTVTPKQRLDVDGNVNFRGHVVFDNVAVNNSVVVPASEHLALTVEDTAGNVFAVLNTATQEIEVERPLYMQSQQIYAVDNNASGLQFETREDHMVFVRLDTVNEHTAFTKPITFEGAAAGDRTVQLMDGLENAMFITGATEAGTVFVQFDTSTGDERVIMHKEVTLAASATPGGGGQMTGPNGLNVTTDTARVLNLDSGGDYHNLIPLGYQYSVAQDFENRILVDIDGSVKIASKSDAKVHITSGSNAEMRQTVGYQSEWRVQQLFNTSNDEYRILVDKEGAIDLDAEDNKTLTLRQGGEMIVRIHTDDTVMITKDTTIHGVTTVSNTAEALTSSSASLTTRGGLGVAKDILVAGNAGINGDMELGGDLNVLHAQTVAASLGVDGVVSFNNNTNSRSTTEGSLVTSGGVGIARNANIGGDVTISGKTYIDLNTTISGQLDVKDVTDATSTSPPHASVTTDGGLAVAQRMMIGGDVELHSTTEATSSSAAALELLGGLGVAKKAVIDGTVTVTDVTDFADPTTASVKLDGGMYVAKDAKFGDNVFIVADVTMDADLDVKHNISVGMRSQFASLMELADTTEALSTYQASFTTKGGIGVAGSAFLGKKLTVEDTTTATSLTAAAAQVNGGLAVAKDTIIGNTVSVLDVTEATDASTASVTFAGGLGVAKKAFITGDTTLGGSVSMTADQVFSTQGDMEVQGNFYLQENATFQGTVSLLHTMNATSENSAALTVAGGIASLKDIDVGGNVRVADRTTLASRLTVTDDQDSTSMIEASMITYGGLSVALDTRIGKQLYVDGDTTLKSDLSIYYNLTVGMRSQFASWMEVNDITEAIVANTEGAYEASIVTKGGVAVSKSIIAGGKLTVQDATDATSSTAASVTMAGGLAVAKDVYLGEKLIVESTREAVDSNDAAAVIKGGLGVMQNMMLEGNITVKGTIIQQENSFITEGKVVTEQSLTVLANASITGITKIIDNTESTSTEDGALIVVGGAGIGKNTNIGGDLRVGGVVQTTAVTGSTSTTTGSLIAGGGMGVAENAFIGGAVSIAATTTSTSTTTGSLIAAGGAGVAENLYVGGVTDIAGAVALGGMLAVSDTTDAASTISASLKTAGGLGVALTSYFGGDVKMEAALDIASQTDIAGVLAVQNTTEATAVNVASLTTLGGLGVSKKAIIGGAVSITDNTGSTSTGTGSLIATGGAGIAENLYVGGLASVAGGLAVAGLDVGGMMAISDTTDATSTISASLKTAGGFGVAKTSYFGGDVKMEAALDIDGQTDIAGVLAVQNTTEATAVNVASLTTLGGLGVSKKAIIGGSLTVLDTTASSDISTGSITTAGGLGVAGYTNVGGDLNVWGGSNIAGQLNVSYGLKVDQHLTLGPGTALSVGSTQDVSGDGNPDYFTGALVSQGGLGVVKNAIVGGRLQVWNTSDSTSLTTGASTVAGGMGISKNLYVGGNIVGSSLTTAAGDSITVDSGDALTLSAAANTELKLQQGVVDRLNFGTQGQIEMRSAVGENITLNSAGGLELMAATGYAAKMSQGNSSLNFVRVDDSGILLLTDTGNNIRGVSGNQVYLASAASKDFEALSGGDMYVQAALGKTLRLQVGRYESVLVADGVTGATTLAAPVLNGTTAPKMTVKGTNARFSGESGSVDIQGQGINLYACDCTDGVCTTDCLDATMKGSNVVLETTSVEGKIRIEAIKEGNDIDVTARDEITFKAYGNKTQASTLEFIAGKWVNGAIKFSQTKAISGQFGMVIESTTERLIIDQDSNIIMTQASGSYIQTKVDQGTNGPDLRWKTNSATAGYHHVLHKTVTMASTPSYTTVASVTLSQYRSAYVEIVLEGTWNSKPSIHVARFLIVHNGGSSPEPDGASSNAINNGILSKEFTMGTGSSISTADVTYDILVAPDADTTTYPATGAKPFHIKYRASDHAGGSSIGTAYATITVKGGGVSALA